MHFAVRLMVFSVVAAVSGAILLAAESSYAASGEEVIKARKNFMEDGLEDQWNVLAAYAKNGKGSLADVEKSAMELGKLAKKIPEHFPKDTGRGKYPDKMTRTLPAVWTNWAGFQKDVQRLADQSAKLASLARAGDKEAAVNLIGKSGKYSQTKLGCAECHDNFRGQTVK